MLNGCVDFCFLLDVIVNFRTTYFDPRTGDEVIDTKMISRNYLKGRFWIDFIATVPVDQLAEAFSGGDADVGAL